MGEISSPDGGPKLSQEWDQELMGGGATGRRSYRDQELQGGGATGRRSYGEEDALIPEIILHFSENAVRT